MYLGKLQKEFLNTVRAHKGPYYVTENYRMMRLIRSLKHKGLIHVTDCGMATAAGRSVYIIQAT